MTALKKDGTQGYKQNEIWVENLLVNDEFNADMKILSLVKDEAQKKKQFLMIARKYGANPAELENYLILDHKNFKIWSKPIISDLCKIVAADGVTTPTRQERAFADHLGATMIQLTAGHQKDWAEMPELFPACIFVHKLASKRSVLDFIEKQWDEVEAILDRHRPAKPRIRKRDQPYIYDFIWKHRNLKTAEIKKLVNTEIRGTKIPPFADFEIRTIIKQEKDRRKRKINVGR